MNRLQEIEKRLADIQTELAADGADIEKLSAEVDALIVERKALIDKNERRQKVLESIANNDIPTNTVAAPFVQAPEQRTYDASSPEYRSAYLKNLMGATLTEVEQRAMTAADAGGTLPVQTLNKVEAKLTQTAPLINEIELLHVPGYVAIGVETVRTDAELHNENAELNPAPDRLVEVKLGGYEIIKLIPISAKVSTMTVDAFENWLVDNLTESIAYKIENYLINGTGSGQPQGVEYANTWTNNTNAIKWAGASLAVSDIVKAIALLPGVFDAGAKILMKKSTLWNNVMPLRKDAEAPIVREAGGKYYVYGYEVILSDFVTAGVIYIGNFKKIYGNFAKDITFASSAISGFRSNSTDYRADCLFDSKVAVPGAFVKLAATL